MGCSLNYGILQKISKILNTKPSLISLCQLDNNSTVDFEKEVLDSFQNVANENIITEDYDNYRMQSKVASQP